MFILPTRRMRKTVWAGAILVVVYLLSRLAIYTIPAPQMLELDEIATLDTQNLLFEICSHIIDGEPFAIDSVFVPRQSIYAFTRIQFNDSLVHNWYLDSTLVWSHSCTAVAVCISQIPEITSPGEWSVDFLVNNRLWATKQFRVLSGTSKWGN